MGHKDSYRSTATRNTLFSKVILVQAPVSSRVQSQQSSWICLDLESGLTRDDLRVLNRIGMTKSKPIKDYQHPNTEVSIYLHVIDNSLLVSYIS